MRRLVDISPLKYVHVRSEDFYKGAYAAAASMPNVEFRYEPVIEMREEGDMAYVKTRVATYEAPWVFSSILAPQKVQPQHHIYIHQHFGGWFIRTEKPAFDPEQMTLMDFRVSQDRGTAFCYILPFAEDAALVEFTVFSDGTWSPKEYDSALETYIERQLGIQHYQIEEKEYGSIPMTNHPLAPKGEGRIVQLGTAGGLTKPTTGYTFRRIQEDVEMRVKAWERHGSPQVNRRIKPRYVFYDDLLLYLLLAAPQLGHGIFEKLFARNHPRDILRFLDEGLTLFGDLWIIGRLPWKPFLQALWRYKVMGQTPLSAYGEPPQLHMPIKRPEKVGQKV